MDNLKVLDLFAGGGGFSTGFLAAKHSNINYELAGALEVDPDACLTLISHHGEDKVIDGDITDPIKKEEVIKRCSNVDVIIGGPPCQTFSLAGPARSGKKEIREKLREDPRNMLYSHFFDLVGKIKPSFVVFENVEGMASKKAESTDLSNKQRAVIDLVCEDLKDLGYNTEVTPTVETGLAAEYQVLNSADYGVPQYRRRIIIIANRIGIANPIPEKTHGDGRRPHLTVKDAIGHLPVRLPKINPHGIPHLKNMNVILDNYKKSLKLFKDAINETVKEDPAFNSFLKWFNRECRRLSTVKENHFDELKKFFLIYNMKLEEVEQTFIDLPSSTSHTSRMHNFRDIIIFILTKPGSNSARFINKNRKEDYSKLLSDLYPYARDKHKDTYVKHSWDKPSYTILAHMEKDGLKFIHPEQPRTYTPYEASLIQSFPGDFTFSGGRNAQYRQIGNAVPPKMAEAIGNSILNALHENNTDLLINETYERV
ncbi:DNA cytosine methyltransferase [Guptibacillus hwajinpoensis]|uniref:DNA cytosine methyltransferase n=1 Tax=Guptibacillus hwajinpoensis TaxID=208199 RepID=UPI003D00C127